MDTLTPKEIAALLSQTMRDLADRKISLRQASALSRTAVALAKVIETVELNDRVALLEQMLKKRK